MEDHDFDYHEYQPYQVQHPIIPAPGSPSSKPRFKIKIKNNLPASASPCPSPSPAHHPKLHGEQQGESWVCEFCGRSFASGKAWGGHKRHHLKLLRENNHSNNDSASSFLKASGKLLKLPQAPPEQEGGGVKEKALCKLGREEENKLGSSIKTIKSGDVRVGNGGRPTCCLCGKDFRSMYSLFGHMRFHPDRGWKGTKPPSKSNCNSENKNPSCCSTDTCISGATGSPEVDNDHIRSNVAAKIGIDLEGSLPLGWSNKDRRGRIGSFDYSMLEAAHTLMTLSRDPRGFSGIKRKVEELTDSGLERNRSSGKMKKPDQESERRNLGVAGDLERKVKRGYRKVVREALSNQKVLNGDYGQLRDSESDRPKELDREEVLKELKKRLDVKKKKKKKKKKMKMNLGGKPGDAREGVPGIGSYDPPEAKRELLPTSQTLGVHKINKAGELADNSTLKNTISIRDEKADLIPMEANGEAIQNENNEDHAPLAMEAAFHCDNCSKTFQTGRALGGHKRCHSKAPAAKDSTPSGEEANNGASAKESTKVSHKILDFDLNEPCVMPDA